MGGAVYGITGAISCSRIIIFKYYNKPTAAAQSVPLFILVDGENRYTSSMTGLILFAMASRRTNNIKRTELNLESSNLLSTHIREKPKLLFRILEELKPTKQRD